MESSEATSGVEVGPALGMKFRDGVREYARAHYSVSGWDCIWENDLSPSELAEVIGPAQTLGQAIEMAGEHVKRLDTLRGQRAFRR
jgi:hypothetical protein